MLRRLLDSPVTYFVSAALLVLVAIATQLDVRVPPLPEGTPQDIDELSKRDGMNVVFVVVDTLRADHLDSYGYARETSPNLTALASQGVEFVDPTDETRAKWDEIAAAATKKLVAQRDYNPTTMAMIEDLVKDYRSQQPAGATGD